MAEPDPHATSPSVTDATVTLDLLRQVQGGDREALDRLLGRYYGRLRILVLARLGARLRANVDCSDILQETFAAAARDFDRFDLGDNGSLLSWLATIARNQICAAADRYGAQKRDNSADVPLVTGDGSTVAGPVPVASGDSPSEVVARREQISHLVQCLSEMPDEQRELILLRDVAGAEWEAVARDTGRGTPDAARMRYRTAINELAARVVRSLHGANGGA